MMALSVFWEFETWGLISIVRGYSYNAKLGNKLHL